jgi:hypothetical protein
MSTPGYSIIQSAPALSSQKSKDPPNTVGRDVLRAKFRKMARGADRRAHRKVIEAVDRIGNL